MIDVLKTLSFTRFQFDMLNERKISFPSFKGNIFRGALGKMLRHLTCAFKNKDCSDCLIKGRCIYSLVFESHNTENISILKGIEKAPHPFVLYIPDPDRWEYPENSKISLSLVLIGKAIEYIPYFILTFEELGKVGIGRERVPFKVDSVKADLTEIYNSQEKKVKQKFSILSLFRKTSMSGGKCRNPLFIKESILSLMIKCLRNFGG